MAGILNEIPHKIIMEGKKKMNKNHARQLLWIVVLACLTAAMSVMGAAAEQKEQSPVEERDVLVVYFSATGTTKGVAEKIAALTGGDIFEIVPAVPYTAADLNWNDRNSRTSIETDDPSCRPEIAGDPVDLEGYSTIYIGYPIWWDDIPRIMSTFAESYDFGEITMIPFCTSGGSGVGRSDRHLEEQAGSGVWLKGTRLQGNISEKDLQTWIGNSGKK